MEPRSLQIIFRFLSAPPSLSYAIGTPMWYLSSLFAYRYPKFLISFGHLGLSTQMLVTMRHSHWWERNVCDLYCFHWFFFFFAEFLTLTAWKSRCLAYLLFNLKTIWFSPWLSRSYWSDFTLSVSHHNSWPSGKGPGEVPFIPNRLGTTICWGWN